MKRRAFMTSGLALAALLVPSSVRAQPAPRVMRVALVGGAPQQEGRERTAKVFAEEGFVEGRNLALEYVNLDDLLPSRDTPEHERRARAVIASQPDAILVRADYINLFKRLTSEIPLVFYWLALDPVRMGLVESYGRPGGNVTGTTWGGIVGESAKGLSTKRKGLELLKELRPRAKRIGFLDTEENLTNFDPKVLPLADEVIRDLSSQLGLEHVDIYVSEKAAFPAVERAIGAARIDLLAVGIGGPWKPDLMRFLERSRIPALWTSANLVREGGLLSANPSFDEAFRSAFGIVAQVLRGGDPATIPVRTSTRYVIAINLRTARAMGLAVPSSILLRADVVVE